MSIRISIFLTLFVCSCFTFAQTSNVTRAPKYIQQKEETIKQPSFPFYRNGNIPVPFLFSIPSNAIPGMVGFSDYATNGRTLKQIAVTNDTVVVGMVMLD